jgi:hypothetical protein
MGILLRDSVDVKYTEKYRTKLKVRFLNATQKPFITSQLLIITMVKGKVKVVPVLFLTEHQAIKAYWGVEV